MNLVRVRYVRPSTRPLEAGSVPNLVPVQRTVHDAWKVLNRLVLVLAGLRLVAQARLDDMILTL